MGSAFRFLDLPPEVRCFILDHFVEQWTIALEFVPKEKRNSGTKFRAGHPQPHMERSPNVYLRTICKQFKQDFDVLLKKSFNETLCLYTGLHSDNQQTRSVSSFRQWWNDIRIVYDTRSYMQQSLVYRLSGVEVGRDLDLLPHLEQVVFMPIKMHSSGCTFDRLRHLLHERQLIKTLGQERDVGIFTALQNGIMLEHLKHCFTVRSSVVFEWRLDFYISEWWPSELLLLEVPGDIMHMHVQIRADSMNDVNWHFSFSRSPWFRKHWSKRENKRKLWKACPHSVRKLVPINQVRTQPIPESPVVDLENVINSTIRWIPKWEKFEDHVPQRSKFWGSIWFPRDESEHETDSEEDDEAEDAERSVYAGDDAQELYSDVGEHEFNEDEADTAIEKTDLEPESWSFLRSRKDMRKTMPRNPQCSQSDLGEEEEDKQLR